jgi:dTDP-4-amino-4,6-dideoxygalactose transaminase
MHHASPARADGPTFAADADPGAARCRLMPTCTHTIVWFRIRLQLRKTTNALGTKLDDKAGPDASPRHDGAPLSEAALAARLRTASFAAPTEPIPVLRPQLPRAERLLPYLRRIDDTRLYSNHGPLSLELERRLSEVLHLPPGGLVVASSGTAALVGAILAAAGRASPERRLAIIPAFTFSATAAAVEQCGYCPYLADVDGESWMLDPARLVDHAKREQFGLVVPVAPFGRPVPQEKWQRFQRVTGVPVVIDGAASFAGLAERPEEFLGAIPVAISCHATKAFATGEGGAVATSDIDLAQRSGQALNFGVSGIRDCRMAGTNGKMSEYHAAVGLAGLDMWPDTLAAFRIVVERYRQRMAAAGLADRFYGAPDIAPNYALFRCRDAAEADRVEHSLRQAGVDFRLWYGGGLHRQTYYTSLPRDALDATDDTAPCLLGLPMAVDLKEEPLNRILTALASGAGELA